MSPSDPGRCDIIKKRIADIQAENFITGLDIGTSKVSAVAAEIDRAGKFTVRAHVTLPSRGMAKGAFVDMHETVDVVAKVLGKIRAITHKRSAAVYVNISGDVVKGTRSRGMIPLALRGREVTRSDIARCADAASTIHLPFDREIIHSIVQDFSVDDQPWIKSPLGLYASRLSAEVCIITASVNHIQSIFKCVNNAGHDVREVVYSGMAGGAALLDAALREEGALLLDLGASLTECSYFTGGALADMEVIPLGSDDIGGTFKDNPVFRSLASRIVAKMDSIRKGGSRIKSVTITGGMAFEDGISEALEEAIGMPVTMGLVKEVSGDVSALEALRLATAIGLCRYAYEKHEKKAREDRDVVKRLTTKVVDLFNSYF